ncbi:hypothetical protein [Sulfolobus acidocaldarius]|uniref:Uncharacterized protein n=3 Tax=Sulfolobus acidocaldarius TaxID=2285 RepID=A0A0U2VXI8_9CREN|nr:hypothetical protein [Sulfolobus acidocaldarius]AGE72067.1 hypothetical protein SacN8_10595 [Sulfolobus acidocaldarius N8]AGE74385.1 hypothetical protein SacRon12I_10845 [Sulfolobus acidocaldarius Ron12/I]ALU29748.1 hypothetical protein ATY89_07215 [Sulfolobus acidocaldarius]ALU32485.1 hypothetical protein ATZ20_10235 [Sulfolobus acidocaldarius]WCM33841.1 hypothetical protein GO597_00050 [Sulfolobus acidocaldarius DSM 639]
MRSESVVIGVNNINYALDWAKNPDNVLGVIPSVVGVEDGYMVLRFRILWFFRLTSRFKIQSPKISSDSVEWSAVDDKGNTFGIGFYHETEDMLRVTLTYKGEKEWIVGRNLNKVLEEIRKGMLNDLDKTEIYEVDENGENAADYSQNLSKLSYLSKLVMKSKMVRTQNVALNVGGVVDYLQEVVSQLSEYPVVYISGSGPSAFRVLYINGEVKGVYVMKDGKEYFGKEDVLNTLSGNYKTQVYVMVSPKLLEGIRE